MKRIMKVVINVIAMSHIPISLILVMSGYHLSLAIFVGVIGVIELRYSKQIYDFLAKGLDKKINFKLGGFTRLLKDENTGPILTAVIIVTVIIILISALASVAGNRCSAKTTTSVLIGKLKEVQKDNSFNYIKSKLTTESGDTYLLRGYPSVVKKGQVLYLLTHKCGRRFIKFGRKEIQLK